MAPERWRNLEEIYHAARACVPDECSGFLAEACGGDEDLRREIESLLANDVSGDSRLDRPVWTDSGSAMTISQPAAGAAGRTLPAYIGRYRILRLIGEGGMGTVYEAEQQQPRRIVALKVIRPGSMSPERLRRFEQESQALGRLQHPGIAQVFEAGTADPGFGPQPYFAMEFIRGETLRDYMQVHQPSSRQRLELMAKVADAVNHAHQRGLIHRDLKPGNILVDETGQPKVLDFGVARVTDSDTQATRQTDLGELVGTLAYMSPEQVLADPMELDTRSDVYALGVNLYELLAGRLPYVISKKLHEAVKTIREEDPTRLSSVSRAYRGDIETIVAKALEKDKARRYASAADLAADIRRYLNHVPIAARPASTTYQVRKFVRRHKAFVFGLAAVFSVLLAGIVVSGHETVRAKRAEQDAVKERDRALNAQRSASRERARAEAEAREALSAKALAEQRAWEAQRERTRAEREAVAAQVAQANAERRLDQVQKLARGAIDTYKSTSQSSLPEAAAARIAENARDSLRTLGAEKPLDHWLAGLLDETAAVASSFGLASDKTWHVPSGWSAAQSEPGEYRVGTDQQVRYAGNGTLFVRSLVAQPSGEVRVFQLFAARHYQGKRVRLAGVLRAQRAESVASLWLVIRSDDPDSSAAESVPIASTSSWKRQEIVLEVPANAQSIQFGIYMTGTGTIWAAHFSFEPVSEAVPLSVPKGPENLDFTKSEATN
jgi:hypothetical protein